MFRPGLEMFRPNVLPAAVRAVTAGQAAGGSGERSQVGPPEDGEHL